MGEISRIGPGLFPLAVSVLLSVCGIALVVRNVRSVVGHSFPWPRGGQLLRSVYAVVLASMTLVVFALLIQPAGLAIATAACVCIAYFGGYRLVGHKGGLVEGLALTAGLTTFSVLVFIYGIGLPLRPWP